MRARNRRLRFAPPASRKEQFTGSPFDGINGDDVHIAMKAAMLESVIENENVSKLFLFRQPASFISICANDDWNISKPLLHEKRFVAGLLPVRTYNQHTAADSAVASRQDHRPKSAIAQSLSEKNDEGRFSGSAKSEIANADNGMIEPERGKNTGLIKSFACAKNEAKRSAHRPASTGSRTCSTRSVAPVFCWTMANALLPSSNACSGLERSFPMTLAS